MNLIEIDLSYGSGTTYINLDRVIMANYYPPQEQRREFDEELEQEVIKPYQQAEMTMVTDGTTAYVDGTAAYPELSYVRPKPFTITLRGVDAELANTFLQNVRTGY